MLETMTQLSDALDLYNIDLSELYNLARALDEFKKLGWDTKVIIGKYEEEQNLESAIKKLESKMKRYETVLEDLHRKRTEQKIQVADHYDAFQVFTKLVKSGLKTEEIINVSNVLKNNFTQESMLQLLEDIEKYGSIAAARAKLERAYPNENPEA
jgi:hypothetical protein